MVFVEASQSPVFQSTDLTFYTVFPTDIFIMLVASFIIVEILDRLHTAVMAPKREEKVRKKGFLKKRSIQISLSILDFLRSIPFLYSFTFLLFIWQGNFKGNTLITSPFSQTSELFGEWRRADVITVPSLRWSRVFVMGVGNSFSIRVIITSLRKRWTLGESNLFIPREEWRILRFSSAQWFRMCNALPIQVPIILGSYDNADWCEEMGDCFQMVCNKSSRVGLFYEPDIYSFFASNLTETCSLAEWVSSLSLLKNPK